VLSCVLARIFTQGNKPIKHPIFLKSGSGKQEWDGVWQRTLHWTRSVSESCNSAQLRARTTHLRSLVESQVQTQHRCHLRAKKKNGEETEWEDIDKHETTIHGQALTGLSRIPSCKVKTASLTKRDNKRIWMSLSLDLNKILVERNTKFTFVKATAEIQSRIKRKMSHTLPPRVKSRTPWVF